MRGTYFHRYIHSKTSPQCQSEQIDKDGVLKLKYARVLFVSGTKR